MKLLALILLPILVQFQDPKPSTPEASIPKAIEPAPPASPAPKPAEGATQKMRDEVAHANTHNMGNPARSWIAGEHQDIIVLANKDMWWKMQSAMLFSSAASKYRAEGIKSMISWNGKKAWHCSTAEKAETEEFTGLIPAPPDDPALKEWAPIVAAYNAKVK